MVIGALATASRGLPDDGLARDARTSVTRVDAERVAPRGPRCRLALATLAAALVFVIPLPVHATNIWAAVVGDPCCGIPDEKYKYLDADEACRGEVSIPEDTACNKNHRNVRNASGPQSLGGCIIDSTCTCSTCQVGPTTGNTMTGRTGIFPYRKPLICPSGTTEYLGRCELDTAKSKGICSDCQLAIGNPVNIVTGNKYQTETIYRAASGRLDVTLTYNSQIGATYFQSGPFGARWSSRLFVRLRDTGQGIVAVERPDGRELEFRAPPSGSLYVADTDIADRLEKLTDAAGNLQGWRFTTSDGDERFVHDGAGRLFRIRDRALVDETMIYSTATTPPSVAPEAGLLIGVSDPYGRQLNFTYDAKRRVATMTDPAGGLYTFEYDGPSGPPGASNLTRITFPDGRARTYFYGEAAQINGGAACAAPSPVHPNALTGVQDENGVRFATWTYDCAGRATSSERALGVSRYVYTYISGSRSYADPLNTQRTVGFTVERILGVARGTGTTQPAADGSAAVSTAVTHDANGNVASRTDWNGRRTNYTYDLARNLETSRTEGLTAAGGPTPETRTISTEWHPTWRLPARIAEPLRITTYVYNGDGATTCGLKADGTTPVPGVSCAKTVQATSDANGGQGFSAAPVGAPRTWRYTYNADGQVLAADGPRSDAPDVTSTTYYADDDPDPGKRGNAATITNAAGHTTRITAYNAHGQPITIIDPNGLATTLTYDARQRLISRTVGTETTTYAYDGVGQLLRVTMPDGSFLAYSYDAAHRLTGMADSLGNSIAYTLDAMGNRVKEDVYDPSNVLAQTRSRVYDNLNRLFRDIGAAGQTTEYGYDNQGNVISVKDPLIRVTSNQYDALNRLVRVTDPNLGVTRYGYNGLDALTSVADPRDLVTGYAVDGLGNLNQQSSPDTGITTSTYDEAGNLVTQTDAKNQTTVYAYDALNRVTSITFADGAKQAYAYDQGANGLGRLTGITETNPASQVTSQIAYGYDAHGRVASESRMVAGQVYAMTYSYDAAGRLAGLTYPTGRSVAYAFDGAGRIVEVTTTQDQQSQVVVQQVQYHPFGGVKSYVLGNGQLVTRTIDLDGRIAGYTLGAESYAIAFDAASRITGISQVGNPANANRYGYDSLDRLTSAVLPSTAFGYSYDPVGNRLTKSTGGLTDLYTYGPTSNRIASVTPAAGTARSFTFDANGSTTADGNNSYAYDPRGRMVGAASAAGLTFYQVNALGQRVRKTNFQGDTVFHYDTRGRLIAETDAAGAPRREILYLGDIPVGVVQ